jgi:hypothetical protein
LYSGNVQQICAERPDKTCLVNFSSRSARTETMPLVVFYRTQREMKKDALRGVTVQSATLTRPCYNFLPWYILEQSELFLFSFGFFSGARHGEQCGYG